MVSSKPPLNTLSRLKGIETLSTSSSGVPYRYFEYTFPFEGNWNIFHVSAVLQTSVFFEYTFPFEGNWNMYDFHSPQFLFNFEYTFPFEGNWNSNQQMPRTRLLPLWIHFPVWRELKRCLSGDWDLFERARSLNTLSRLKGIETVGAVRMLRVPRPFFEYTFPLEGNRNLLYARSVNAELPPVRKGFPVGRESKLYTQFNQQLSLWLSPQGLSRSKGIETIFSASFSNLCKTRSGRTFPFKRNRNTIPVTLITCRSLGRPESWLFLPSLEVRKGFPVQRECI